MSHSIEEIKNVEQCINDLSLDKISPNVKIIRICFMVSRVIRFTDYRDNLVKYINTIINTLYKYKVYISIISLNYCIESNIENIIDFTDNYESINIIKYIEQYDYHYNDELRVGFRSIPLLNWNIGNLDIDIKTETARNIIICSCLCKYNSMLNETYSIHDFNSIKEQENMIQEYKNLLTEINSTIKNIEFYFGKINDYSDNMIRIFNESLKIIEFDNTLPTVFYKKIINIILNKNDIIIKYNKNENDIKGENNIKGELISYQKISNIDEFSDYIYFDLHKEIVHFSYDDSSHDDYFHNEHIKSNYNGFIYTNSNKLKVVFKKYKEINYDIYYLKKNAIAIYLADIYNKISQTNINLSFIEAKLINYNTIDHFIVDNYIDYTNYFKFNYSDYYNEEKLSYIEILQGFSCWTWRYSNNYLMIANSNAISNKTNIILTDPIIYSSFHEKRFGSTNLGDRGINTFIRHHKCNEHCLN